MSGRLSHHQPAHSEAFLGDGLYASIDGGMLILRAPREAGDHWVAESSSDAISLESGRRRRPPF